MELAPGQPQHASPTRPRWHEVFDPRGQPRPGYERPLRFLQKLRAAEMRALDERMEATLREMGVSFAAQPGEAQRPWTCDLLPHIFSAPEWEQIVSGVRQRLRAFEFFLRDVHGGK